MPIYYDVSGTLVSEEEYLDVRAALVQAQNKTHSELDLGDGRTFKVDAYRPMLAIPEKNGGVREFEPIGIGKPLTLWITSAYTGNLPPKGGLGGRRKGCLLSSAVKSWSYQDAKPRALNALKKEVARNSEIQFAGTERGTQIAFYSPALIERQLQATFEMAFDDIDEAFYTSISHVMSSAATLPVFASASPYLLAVGTLFKLGARIANGLYDGKAEFQATETLRIDLPGEPAQAGYRLITRTEIDRAALTAYGIREGRLVNKADPAVAYTGDIPHLVIALDGTMDKSLEGFSAQAAGASLLEQFYNVRENSETSAAAFIEAFKLYNDFRYSREALDLKKSLEQPGLSDKEKARLQERYEAVVKNIVTDEFKPKDG